MDPVLDIEPIVKVSDSVDSELLSSMLAMVTVNVVTPVGTDIVPSPLLVTPFEKTSVEL
jgi:hypothetical protein